LLVPPASFVLWLFALWPPPVWYRTHFPAETAFMRMRRSEASWTDRKAKRRDGGRLYAPVTLERIAPAMALAAITGEDNNFLEHDGIDYAAIRKALGYRRRDFDWDDSRDRADLQRALGRAWERRAALRGASTITQQLAKNLYLSSSRNPLRKVTAYRLERALGKRRIIELYLNIAEMGDDVWGVESASRYYYRKPAAKLSRAEAASLAGLLPFPLRSNPTLKPGRMRWRQNLILRRMAGERLEIPKTEAETPEDTTGEGRAGK
jgi:monofunctional biosynthetic peptidoglycan transglycosylase